MKIFFVKPGGRDWINYPSQYAVLSSYLKLQGHEIAFHDGSLEIESPETAFSKADMTGYDVLGISIYTASQNWAKTFIAYTRKKYPSIKIVVGGPHISSLETPAVEHVDADFGIVGEGELPFAELLKKLSENAPFNNIPGLIWKENGVWKDTLIMPRLRIRELDSLPYPDYEMIPPSNYFQVFRGASVARRREKCAFMFTSRGCPYMCTYCATNCTWENKLTAFSAKRVVEEMLFLKKTYGVGEVWFGDDTFTFSKVRTKEICRLLIEQKADLLWRLPNGIRLETVDDETISMMSKAGCYMTGVGVETGSLTAMAKIKKKLDLSIVRDKLDILKKYKVLSSGFFIFGLPWETPEQIEETAKFIVAHPFDRMQISIFNPYPGSEEFDFIMNKANPEIYAKKVREYLYEGKIEPFLQHLDLDSLYKKSRETFFKFYLQPRVIWSIIKGINFQQIYDIIRHPFFKSIFKKKHDSKDTYIDLNT